MKKHYSSPDFDFIKVDFENVLSQLDDSKPNIPVEDGDPGKDT